ncbi:hypothetical protein SLA2020_414850 [Shorea laevis]
MEDMMLLYSSLSLLVVAIAFKLIYLRTRTKHLPPSPRSLPIIGHLHLLKKPHTVLSTTFRKNTARFTLSDLVPAWWLSCRPHPQSKNASPETTSSSPTSSLPSGQACRLQQYHLWRSPIRRPLAQPPLHQLA